MTYWSGQVGPTTARGAAAGRAAHWIMTSRHGGVSAEPFDDWNLAAHVGDEAAAVQSNRDVLATLAGLSGRAYVYMRQCHSADVAVVRDAGVPEVQQVDALVTDTPGLLLVALAADCVPVALMDVQAGVVAAVHSGWQGMVRDVVGSAINQMVDLGAEPGRIRAVLGPSICGACYAVPPERQAEAAAAQPASAVTAADGQPAIDVRAGLAARLRSDGILVESVGGCTAEDPELFSYRRDGLTGRQGVAVWWTRP